MRARSSDVGGEGEAPLDEREAVGKLVGRAPQEEVRPASRVGARPGPVEPAQGERAVEDLRRRAGPPPPEGARPAGPRATSRGPAREPGPSRARRVCASLGHV